MDITNEKIDDGKAFDWGRVSAEYVKYRDIYPKEFYDKIISLGLCTKGQKVLDVGTGTGVLPRHLYEYGADFVCADISENQIEAAKILAKENKTKTFSLLFRLQKILIFHRIALMLLQRVSAFSIFIMKLSYRILQEC